MSFEVWYSHEMTFANVADDRGLILGTSGCDLSWNLWMIGEFINCGNQKKRVKQRANYPHQQILAVHCALVHNDSVMSPPTGVLRQHEKNRVERMPRTDATKKLHALCGRP